MPSSMPEFEMPAGVEPPPRPEAAPPATVRPAHTAEPDASGTLDAPQRAGFGWRHVLVGALLGAVVGAAIPGGIQLAERAAGEADSDSLRAVAMAYLTAIAEGRAGEATAIVPLRGQSIMAPDAVLQSADRIEDAEVRLVHIDGDIGSVEVRYDVGSTDVARTLEAERQDGRWLLTTPLAEPLQPLTFDSRIATSIAGFELPAGRGLQVYPGRYSFDEQTGPVLINRSEPFIVDGDPRTPTEAYVDMRLAPDLVDYANRVALEVVRTCRAAEDCALPQGEVEVMGHGFLQVIDEHSFEVSVPLLVGADTLHRQGRDVRLVIVTDAAGLPEQWLCAPVDSPFTPDEPCPEP